MSHQDELLVLSRYELFVVHHSCNKEGGAIEGSVRLCVVGDDEPFAHLLKPQLAVISQELLSEKFI